MLTAITGRARNAFLRGLDVTGGLRLIKESRWRKNRLLIICYHGVSIDDEHEWRPALYFSAERFEQRLQMLKFGEYSVVNLADGIERLYQGKLPPRSVALTFDDGMHDFYSRAFPLLKTYGFTATVYQRTDYSGTGLPIFMTMVSYLLWKGKGKQTGFRIGENRIELDTRTGPTRQRAHERITEIVRTGARLSAEEKDQIVERLAGVLGLDYQAIKRKRILNVMGSEEIREVARAGMDIQLHMHNHHSPKDEAAYREQIRLNREIVEGLSGRPAEHFCYPSGEYADMFLPWLEKEGIQTATTGVPGLASASADPLLLPRFVDTGQRTALEFEGWLAGAGHFLARRGRY